MSRVFSVLAVLASANCGAVAAVPSPVTAAVQAYSLQLLEPFIPFAVVFVFGTLTAAFFTRRN